LAAVFLVSLQELGNKLLASVNCIRLLELSELAILCGQEDLEQLQVVVRGLCWQGKAAIKQGSSVLIKLGDPNISELDVGVYTLQHNEQTLTKHIEQLEAEKQMAVQEARLFMAKNMRLAVSFTT
jgi:hypothetical protein